jgi:hypothetical protein
LYRRLSGPRAGLEDAEKRKFLTLPGLEVGPLSGPVRSQSLYRLKTKTDTQLKFYKITAVPCLMYGIEILNLRRIDEKKTEILEAVEMRCLRYVADYNAWDKERRYETRSQLGTRKLDEYTYMKGRNTD